MKFEKEFKDAISQLPSKEKDKLILRLLKKDLVLTNRLYFELLDDRTSSDKRAIVEKRIITRIEQFCSYESLPGYLMMYMREVSGYINEHVTITKDKHGEISLNLLMLIRTLELKNKEVLEQTYEKAYKFCIYVIARAFKVLILIKKMHEDLWLEFYDDLKKLGQLVSENDYLMKTAIRNGFDVNWLLTTSIPTNIEQIHKDIRKQGFLK